MIPSANDEWDNIVFVLNRSRRRAGEHGGVLRECPCVKMRRVSSEERHQVNMRIIRPIRHSITD